MSQEFRTADLALATYLNIQDHNHICLELIDRRSAVWVFSGNGDLAADVETYEDGGAEVEVKTFTLKLREVRDELYEFLKDHREQVRA